MGRVPATLLLLLWLVWPADLGHGPGLLAARGEELAAPQPDVPVSLTLRIPEPRRSRPGELIPFELVFESAVKGRFEINLITGDRSGRLPIDELRVDPLEPVNDPLADYFASLRGIAGGGAFSTRDPGEGPVAVSLHLNEWFVFDVPGTYQRLAAAIGARVAIEPV